MRHRLELVGLGKDPLALEQGQHLEELARGHHVGVQVQPLALEQRQRPGHERIGDAGPLQHDRTLTPPARRPQAIGALRRGGGRRQPQGRPVENRHRRARDEGGDDRGRLRQRRRHEEPDLLGLPGRERDHGAGREVVLQQLEGLRVGMGRAVLARHQPRVGADEEERPVGSALGRDARLVADGVEPRGDVPERGDEGPVGRADADMAAERRDAGEHGGHRVLADAADRELPRRGVVAPVVEAGGKPSATLLTLVEARRSADATTKAPPLARL